MCYSSGFKTFEAIYGFDYVECKKCQNLYLQNPLANIAELYENDGTESHFDAAYYGENIFPMRLKEISTPKAEFIHKVVGLNIPKHNDEIWLDIGCGAGELLFAARELGYKVLGYESDLKAVNFANEKLQQKLVIQGFLDIQNCDLQILESIKMAKIISFLNVLEHLEFPRQTLEFFGKQMQKNAFLVLEIPRHPSLASFANSLVPGRVYRHLIAPFHLNIFSELSLKMVYESCGFKLAGQWCYGQGFMDVIHNFSFFDKQEELYKQISEISSKVQKVIDENDLSDFLLIVLQKI